MTIAENLNKIKLEIGEKVKLVAVSKTKPIELIEEAYQAGHRDFGENKARELEEKAASLPKDIHWHFIGNLQRNKVKYIAKFVHLIHSVDSLKLLKEINKEAKKNNRVINCLLQMYIAKEEAKHGLQENELEEILDVYFSNELTNIRIKGLMGMATNTSNSNVVADEFSELQRTYQNLKMNRFATNFDFEILSMGMSQDYHLAIKNGSNMVRIGTAIFSKI